MKKRLPLLFILAACFYTGLAQQNNVGINTATPDPSAALHVEATDKGILIPRMTTDQREMINNAANGLLVYDITTNSFWFFQNNDWKELVGGDAKSDGLADADGDTRVQVEETPNDNTIRFDVQGVESMVLTQEGNLQIKGGDPDDAGFLELFNGDTTQFLRFFGGRLNDPLPFLGWQANSPLRFVTSNADYSGFTEHLRIDEEGKLGVGTDIPQEKVEVAGNVKATAFLGDGSQLTGLLPAGPQAGDITYYDGSAWQRIAKGLVGSVLRMGNNGMPEWAGTTEGLLEVTLPNSEILYIHPMDNSTNIIWGEFGTDIPGLPNIISISDANMDYNGENNTQAIVDQLQNYNSGNYAAKLCTDLVAFGFDDWYLPAAGELNMMYQQLGPMTDGGSGNIRSGFYWSSSEVGVFGAAWLQVFDNGSQGFVAKDSDERCRCVRR